LIASTGGFDIVKIPQLKYSFMEKNSSMNLSLASVYGVPQFFGVSEGKNMPVPKKKLE
jgi:hypothetical protein